MGAAAHESVEQAAGLERVGFERVQPNRTGRPGYDPADLLKLYPYGYLNRIRSRRHLEAETHRLTAGTSHRMKQ